MSRKKKQTGRYVVEINDWGCGTLIKNTLTGKKIDAPAEETVNLCIKEMNALAAENERLRKAGDAMFDCIKPLFDDIGYYYGFTEIDAKARADWLAAKEGRDAK